MTGLAGRFFPQKNLKGSLGGGRAGLIVKTKGGTGPSVICKREVLRKNLRKLRSGFSEKGGIGVLQKKKGPR